MVLPLAMTVIDHHKLYSLHSQAGLTAGLDAQITLGVHMVSMETHMDPYIFHFSSSE